MRKADNLPPSCAVVTKSGDLNFLEPSGPVKACNGTALPLPFKTQPNVHHIKHIFAVHKTLFVVDVNIMSNLKVRW